jgi:hypothetical protein
MVEEVRASPVIHTDDTPVVLQESSDGERATGRLWIYRDLTVAWCTTSASHAVATVP